MVKKNDTREFPGLPIGTFIALPQVVLSATRDDNIYARRTDETEDTIFTLSPSLVLQSDWDRHELSVDLGADLDRYQDATSEDVEDFWLGLDGTRELTEHARVFGGLRHTRDHEDRYVPGAAGRNCSGNPPVTSMTKRIWALRVSSAVCAFVAAVRSIATITTAQRRSRARASTMLIASTTSAQSVFERVMR